VKGTSTTVPDRTYLKPGDTLPWEGTGRSLGSLVKTWAWVIARPWQALEGPAQGGWSRPVLFAVLVNLVHTILLWAMMRWLPPVILLGQPLLKPSTVELARRLVLLVPLVNLVGVLVQAGILHVLLKLLGGARRGFMQSLRVACYAQAPRPLALLGIPGQLGYLFWNLGILAIGLGKAHQVGWRTPVAAVVIYLVVTLGLSGWFRV